MRFRNRMLCEQFAWSVSLNTNQAETGLGYHASNELPGNFVIFIKPSNLILRRQEKKFSGDRKFFETKTGQRYRF